MTRITRTTPTDRDAINLARPAFVFALALLLANDLVLKAAYPGWFTGKLSDFAGLFALPYFLAWLWPTRRLALHVGVALAFVAWKLPLSRPFVELWNSAPWFDIARVEDLTDLFALASVAFSLHATRVATNRTVHVPNVVIAVVALIAFTATPRTDGRAAMGGNYVFPGDLAALEAKLEALGHSLSPPGSHRPNVGSGPFGTMETDSTWLIAVPSQPGPSCHRWTQFEADIGQLDGALLFQLRAVRGSCAMDEKGMRELVRYFNRTIAGPVGLQPVRPVGESPQPGNALP